MLAALAVARFVCYLESEDYIHVLRVVWVLPSLDQPPADYIFFVLLSCHGSVFPLLGLLPELPNILVRSHVGLSECRLCLDLCGSCSYLFCLLHLTCG